jgi:hypothetical protein
MITRGSVDISRRHFLDSGRLAVPGVRPDPRGLFAHADDLVENAFQQAATAKVTVQTLRRNGSVLLGPGGNIAVLSGPDGELLVDAEIVTSRPHVSPALASINADPIKQLINTHWQFDHTGGKAWLHRAGGSIDGQIRAAEANIARVTDRMIVVPGHGAVGSKAKLILFRDVMVEIRGNVAALKNEGKSLAGVVAAKPSMRYDEEWGNRFMSPSRFIALVYRGV